MPSRPIPGYPLYLCRRHDHRVGSGGHFRPSSCWIGPSSRPFDPRLKAENPCKVTPSPKIHPRGAVI
jgi:hypothetical protein